MLQRRHIAYRLRKTTVQPDSNSRRLGQDRIGIIKASDMQSPIYRWDNSTISTSSGVIRKKLKL